MLEVQELSRNHLGNDVVINQRLGDFVRQRFDNGGALAVREALDDYSTDTKCGKEQAEADDEGYGFIKPKEYHVVDVTRSLKHVKIDRAKDCPGFDDSDYDEVLDELSSAVRNSGEDVKDHLIENPRHYAGTTLDISSKRSSASSGAESVASTASLAHSSSGVESGEERPMSKYSHLDVAKILHTRKRIRRILHNPPETPTPETEANEDDSVNSSQRKKSSSVTKRNTYYGTLGRRSKSTPKRPQSISRPLSTGESDFSDALQTREQTAFGTLRHRREPSMGLDDNIFTSETPTTRESDSDNSSRRNSDSFDTRRWSRLSSNSQHSDKVQNTPQKGPMKAFKRFVYLNNNNPGASVKGTLSHEEKKAMIQVCVEASQNDNNSNNLLPGSEPSSHCYPLAKAEALAYPSNSCLACGSENMSRTEEPVSEPLHASTTSLFRRLSRKSPSRGRDTRRSSLPSQNMHLVRSTSQPRTSKLSTRSDYGDGSSKPDVESRVVESAEKVQRSQSAKSKTLGKSNSLKRKFLSFARRRPSEKKSSPKKRNDEGAGMNKTLSYSSPQLSIFSVNAAGSGTSRASLAQKLVF